MISTILQIRFYLEIIGYYECFFHRVREKKPVETKKAEDEEREDDCCNCPACFCNCRLTGLIIALLIRAPR